MDDFIGVSPLMEPAHVIYIYVYTYIQEMIEKQKVLHDIECKL